MKRLLHIIASPREEESRTLQISGAFLDAFVEKHPDWVIDELNLATESLPSLASRQVGGKYVLLEGKNLFGRLREAWVEIIQHIDRFKTADVYLITTPMWNFSVPYMLKHYIDLIVQPRYLFAYDEKGEAHGLLENKKMVVVATRGGEYVKNTEQFDFQEPYLKAIFGFVGIRQFAFIKAEPMDKGFELQKEKIGEAKLAAQKLARGLDV